MRSRRFIPACRCCSRGCDTHNCAKSRTNSPLTDSEEIQSLADGAFCGIGNPESFFQLLQREGYSLTYQRSFRDHHNFTQADVDLIVREAQSKGAQALLTTAKDAVKLRS
jgi:tetraacyldisaccharide-1-P 4'-kinase